MPRLKRSASKRAKRARMNSEMSKFKEGRLHSGSRKGPIVKGRDQAIAIGLSESGQSRRSKRKGKKSRRYSRS